MRAHDERHRHQRVAERNDPPLRPPVERCGVEGDQHPEADGDGRRTERQHQSDIQQPAEARRGGDRQSPRETRSTVAISAGDHREPQRDSDRRERVDTRVRRPAASRSAPSLLHAVSDQPSPTSNERVTRATIGAPTMHGGERRPQATSARSRELRAGRGAACAARVRATSVAAAATANTITTASRQSCIADSAAAPPTSPSCVARRAISTSSVGFVGPPSNLATPNEVKLNRKITAAARPQCRLAGSAA